MARKSFEFQQPISKTALSELLCIDRAAVNRALAQVPGINGKNPPLYPLQPAIIAVTKGEKEKLDAQQERARKDKEQADKIAMENAITRKEYAPVEVLDETIGNLIAAFKGVLRRARDIPEERKVEFMNEIAACLEKEAKG